MRAKALVSLLSLFSLSVPAVCGGPRFIASTSAANAGAIMAFRIPNPQYFTDPGDLTSGVTHAQADAAIAAAAAVWTVPTSTLSLTQGGALQEHVSAANTYFDGTNVVFPSDAQASNYLAMPIAIIYDRDGSITDLLKGGGASDPLSCRQNAVTESVDGFGSDATIQHALMVINGKCFGPSHDQMMQLQYDVMRAFGRIVGLGWSQVNDNVFTGSPTPTAAQMANWPVMHPMDVVCGPYTYLCTQNPFALRLDDLNALAALYPVTSANITAGKVLTMQGATAIAGLLSFPGRFGMDGVNLVVTRVGAHAVEGWESVSAISGLTYAKNFGNPVTGPADAEDSIGGTTYNNQAMFSVARLPQTADTGLLYITMESINPLYEGAYALGPFQRPPVPLAGTAKTVDDYAAPSATPTVLTMQQNDAPMTCPWELGPYETYPNAFDATGWWSSVMCGAADPRWRKLTVKSGHSWTVEVQALDELGQHATGKLQPVIGVWKTTDPTGTLPTVASATVPMNTSVTGLTQLAMSTDSANNTYRLAVADYYGGGRPDFLFQARVLYADSVTPAVLPTAGGQITITGMGFANGNRVLVNGVVAQVASWSANTIVATAPSLSATKAVGGTPLDVEVMDMTTGATTNIAGAVTYPGGGTRQLVAVSQPSSLETGVQAVTAFAVKVLAADGVTPVSGATVQLAVTGGATMGACGLANSCTVTSNAAGIATTTVTGTAAGAVTLRATEMSGGVSVQVALTDADPVRSVVMSSATVYAAAGATLSLPLSVNTVQDGLAASGVTVAWTVSSGLSLSAGSTVTASSGAAAVTVYDNALGTGTATVQGCAWTTVCAKWSLVSVAASQWTPGVVSGAGQSVQYGSMLQPVVMRVTDTAGHALAGATVTVAQTVTAWEGVCPAQGRCPSAPVLASNQTSAVTDASGLVTVTPLQVSGVPQVVNVAFATGTTGFVSMALVKTP
jgi:hypothetical protein